MELHHPLPDRETEWPISQGFGENAEVYKAFGQDGHNGIDYPAPEGTIVAPAAPGRVIYAGDGSGHPLLGTAAGNAVLVEHEAGYLTGYAHLRQVWTQAGAEVDRRSVLGCVGSTGFASGPHLHFEVIKLDPIDFDNGFMGRVDPMEFMS